MPEEFTNMDVTFINKRNFETFKLIQIDFDDHFITTLVVFILCGMAEFASKAGEAKLSASIWRFITTFCTGKLRNSINRLAANNDALNCFEFLLSAVKTGCVCIQYGLQEICEVM